MRATVRCNAGRTAGRGARPRRRPERSRRGEDKTGNRTRCGRDEPAGPRSGQRSESPQNGRWTGGARLKSRATDVRFPSKAAAALALARPQPTRQTALRPRLKFLHATEPRRVIPPDAYPSSTDFGYGRLCLDRCAAGDDIPDDRYGPPRCGSCLCGYLCKHAPHGSGHATAAGVRGSMAAR